MECKDYSGACLPFGKSGLKAHQWIALQECHAAGGVGLLLWSHGDFVAALDMDLFRALMKGRKSIQWKSIPDEWVRPFSVVGIMELFEKHRV